MTEQNQFSDREQLIQEREDERRKVQYIDLIKHFEVKGEGTAVFCLAFYELLTKDPESPFSRDEILSLLNNVLRGGA